MWVAAVPARRNKVKSWCVTRSARALPLSFRIFGEQDDRHRTGLGRSSCQGGWHTAFARPGVLIEFALSEPRVDCRLHNLPLLRPSSSDK